MAVAPKEVKGSLVSRWLQAGTLNSLASAPEHSRIRRKPSDASSSLRTERTGSLPRNFWQGPPSARTSAYSNLLFCVQAGALNSLARALAPDYVHRSLRLISIINTLRLRVHRDTLVALIQACAQESLIDTAHRFYWWPLPPPSPPWAGSRAGCLVCSDASDRKRRKVRCAFACNGRIDISCLRQVTFIFSNCLSFQPPPFQMLTGSFSSRTFSSQ